MSWQSYVDNLMADGTCQDVAIVGYIDTKSVWAAHAGGILASITTSEIDVLSGPERNSFFTNGLTLGNQKCSLLRDNFNTESDWTMDIRTKSTGGGPTYNISIARSGKALVVVMGKDGIHGGQLNKKAHTMATYLRNSGY